MTGTIRAASGVSPRDRRVPTRGGREIATAIGERLAPRAARRDDLDRSLAVRSRAAPRGAGAFPELSAVDIDERQRGLAAHELYAPHISYFYCHGGVTTAGTPYLEVGPRGTPAIQIFSLT
jgi:hypothetical protein